MKGARLIIMVLLTVLAIPLFADQPLGNTVGEFSAISIIISQEEVKQQSVSAILFENQALLPDDRKKIIPLLEFSDSSLTGPGNNNHNPVIFDQHKNMRIRRIKSGRH